MRILVEEYRYDRTRAGQGLSGLDALFDDSGAIPYVGYYFNLGSGPSHKSYFDDLTFILPKVVLDEQKLIFGRFTPEEMIFPQEQNLTDSQKRFLAEFPLWLYRAINVYRLDGHSDSSIIRMSRHADIGKNHGRKYDTYLDILLALLEFNRENRNFFFYILRNIHSGYNRINWTRTIATTDAIVQDETPVYISPVNRRRQINFDEELLVIFYSILNYMSEAYGFPKATDLQFDLISGKKFEKYLNGYGKTRLHQIKYKYFSDKALKLWNLCYDFFDMAGNIVDREDRSDYLLAKNFYIVFEAMIDKLIGDKDEAYDLDNTHVVLMNKKSKKVMDKNQRDGKIVDHLFKWTSLFDNSGQMYYIADSKYYKTDNPLSSESIYKQYTYARNVIQCHIDIFPPDKNRIPGTGIIMRDELTEGYNIIPNFFVSAKPIVGVDDYSDRSIVPSELIDERYTQEQFNNRLFDRDTMLLFHFNVSFPFVLKLYARNNPSDIEIWKKEARNDIMCKIQRSLSEKYHFFVLRVRHLGRQIIDENIIDPKVQEFIEDHFKELNGKIFAPYNNPNIFIA
ncbi:MAG: LlaJI family restriction endonuclease [Bacteroidales bacterium]|nr:LlaJI family restriction endonuclease [Bacteroidales bacterium]